MEWITLQSSVSWGTWTSVALFALCCFTAPMSKTLFVGETEQGGLHCRNAQGSLQQLVPNCAATLARLFSLDLEMPHTLGLTRSSVIM